jgi:HSP20 family molecular chaperone IbpA
MTKDLLPSHFRLGDIPSIWNVFEDSARGNPYPPYNIIKGEDGYVLEMAVPGLTKNDLRATFDEGILTIEGSKRDEFDEKTESYQYKGLSTKAFKRSFTVSNTLKVSELWVENGLLIVDLPFQVEPKRQPELLTIE